MGTRQGEMKIATYNVNGVLKRIKRSKILSKLRKDKVEVLYLQETHMRET